MSDINNILKKQLEKVKIDEETFLKIKKISDEFCKELKIKLSKRNIDATVFIGGSLAKNTLIKTDEDKYDVDIFVRFNNKYNSDKISGMLEKILDKGFKKIHGSRDYFQKNVENITLEVIPVIKINDSKDAQNITDLSYFHVNYVLLKLKKDKKLSDEIRLAKSFCHAVNSYGAESYIRGFSGYALELLIINYKSFYKFIKAISESNEKKVVIDIEKMYRNKKDVLILLNESKILSPIILVDPTFKERNALSSLSEDTFNKFKKSCIDFIKNPSEKFFIKKNINEEFSNIKNIKIVTIKTTKQPGDISGTKSKKFFNFFTCQLKREFIIKKSGFIYNENENIAKAFFSLENKKPEIIRGPDIIRVEHLKSFKEKHPNAYIKNQICYSEITHEKSFEEFFNLFLEKDKKIINEMGISELKLL